VQLYLRSYILAETTFYLGPKIISVRDELGMLEPEDRPRRIEQGSYFELCHRGIYPEVSQSFPMTCGPMPMMLCSVSERSPPGSSVI